MKSTNDELKEKVASYKKKVTSQKEANSNHVALIEEKNDEINELRIKVAQLE